MRRQVFAAVVLAVTGLSLAGCGAAGSTPAAEVPREVTSGVQAAPLPPTVVASATAAREPAVTSWTMPDLVGSGLQDAQDAIQALTSYGIAITRSHDATGAGRRQILDRDWKVCTQNVRPGTTIMTGTSIDFGAAKLGESC